MGSEQSTNPTTQQSSTTHRITQQQKKATDNITEIKGKLEKLTPPDFSQYFKPKPLFSDEDTSKLTKAKYAHYTDTEQTPNKTSQNKPTPYNDDDSASDSDIQEMCIVVDDPDPQKKDFKVTDDDYKVKEEDYKEWTINRIIQNIDFTKLYGNDKKQFNANTPIWKFIKNHEDLIYDHLKDAAIVKVDHMQKAHKTLVNDMSFDEIAAIFLYTTSHFYKELNASLRGHNDEWSPVCGPLISGLMKLPYEWKKVYRGQSWIPDKVREKYKPGRVIRWEQFASTSTKEQRAIGFAGSNGYIFEIMNGYHGRDISQFSAFPTECEILFNLSSHFLITETYEKQGKLYIRLKELPFPWDSKAVLWVDDIPTNNRKLMEKLEKQGIMVIPRISTQGAIEFLDFMHHAFNRNEFDQFRIITDMHRFEYTNDDTTKEDLKIEDKEAGVTLIQHLRIKGYNHTVCIYCSNTERTLENCKKRNLCMDNVIVTNSSSQVTQFASFKN